MADLVITEVAGCAAAAQIQPRTHSKAQLKQIAASIRTFGFNNPVLVDKDNGIVAGHGRVEAAKLLGLATCADDPAASTHRGTEARLHSCRQQTGREGRLGREILAIELQHLRARSRLRRDR